VRGIEIAKTRRTHVPLSLRERVGVRGIEIAKTRRTHVPLSLRERVGVRGIVANPLAMEHKHHPPSPDTTARSRQLRTDSTWPEKVVWGMLRARRLGGLKFRRQYPIGPYTVDFYRHEVGLVVEVDGASHEDRAEHDDRRTAYLRDQGLRVFRVTNSDVMSDSEAVARGIAMAAGVAAE
jgi:very-short-patch-repair endonuclease